MSILIKGMEVPKSCVDCSMFDWDLEYLKCKANDKYFKANGEWRKGIEPTCPLIEVPEDVQPVKHGRWIQLTQNVEPTALKCSLCGEISCCHGMYCPDCGARMDGEA